MNKTHIEDVRLICDVKHSMFYPGYYFSEMGDAFGPNGLALSNRPNSSGYVANTLAPELKSKVYVLRHRAVWQTFKGDFPYDMQVWHKDGDPTNNAIDNLVCDYAGNNPHRRQNSKKVCRVSPNGLIEYFYSYREASESFYNRPTYVGNIRKAVKNGTSFMGYQWLPWMEINGRKVTRLSPSQDPERDYTRGRDGEIQLMTGEEIRELVARHKRKQGVE